MLTVSEQPLQWIDDVFVKVHDAIQAAGDALVGLVGRLNAVTFEGNSTINLILGTFRYLVGDPLYLLVYSMFMIGAGLILYILIRNLISSIASLLPKLKNKLPLG